MWALRFLKENGGRVADVLRMLGLRHTNASKRVAQAALGSALGVFYFSRDGSVQDISQLDPGSDDDAERGWGGLTTFSSTAGEVVAEVADRNA